MFLVFCNTKSYSSEEATFNITKNTIIIFVQDNVSKGSFDPITSFNLSCSTCCHSSLLVGPCHQPFKNFVTPKRRREGKYLPERRFFAAIEYPQRRYLPKRHKKPNDISATADSLYLQVIIL